ncbi:collagen alpha-1(I) chain-like [Anopheles aquasalis]|uniref:collagen alpha-1(I) chain-like n=1 Tax=Anopheles aquasalis TaxID=42839 RepID=UPI00215A34DA|nr:collagen alpha-1(I) chain-like [Anopheles aquasalis]
MGVNVRVKEKVRHGSAMASYENRRLKVLAICVMLSVSTLLPTADGLKSSKSRSKSSSSSSSSGRVSKPSTSYSNPGSLSYSNYQAKPAPKPSAPVDTSSSQRNIGWNVNNQQSKPAVQQTASVANKPPPYPVQASAPKNPPYPVQQMHNTHQTHGAPPPAYSPGAPPPYSAVNNPNVNTRFEPPPMYSAGNQGFKPGQPGFGQPGHFGQPGAGGFGQPGAGGFGQPAAGGFGQPAAGGFGHHGGYGGQPAGGFGQPAGGFPAGGYGGGGYHAPVGGFGAPHGTFQGGGMAPPVNYAPAPSFPIAAIPMGAYKPQSSGIGVGGIAAGIGTGLLAGAAGSALYNALRPEDRVQYRDRVTIINNAPPPAAAVDGGAAAAPAAPAAAPVAPVAPAAGPPAPGAPAAPAPVDGQGSVPLAPFPSADNANAASSPAVAAVPDAPVILNQNATAEQATNGTDSGTPLAPLPEGAPNGTETTTVNPMAKQYFPPPGQYYPATGQYVPPGEYDPATGVFTPGRYIPDTNIFQSGQYDPLTQMFIPGRYEANGQFVPDPNHPPLSLAPDGATPAPETVTPAAASQLQTPTAVSGAAGQSLSILSALATLLVSGGLRLIVGF